MDEFLSLFLSESLIITFDGSLLYFLEEIGLLTFFIVYHGLDCLIEVDVSMGDGTANHAGLVVRFINTLLAVLKVQTEVVILEISFMILLNVLNILYLSQRTKGARIEERILRVVE